MNSIKHLVGDKGVHYFICLLYSLSITLVILFISGSYLFGVWSGALLGLYAGTGLSMDKGYGDAKAHGNYWNWGDILADMLGTISSTVIASFIYWIF